MCCGQGPAHGTWQRSNLVSPGTWDGADLSCPCTGMVSGAYSVVLLLSLPCGFSTGAPCTESGERPDIMESLTPAQLALGVKGLAAGILFVFLSLSGSLAEAGKQGLYKQRIKAIVFWAMNRSGEDCFLTPICCIVDPFRQNKGLHKSQGQATCFGIVWI